ncbi:hypothetical protein EDB85DRAFT_2276518 [Lactarius pseudohatsudake]|nr:hypothetical protein EDB85DRAFT_2276518 [Lactarius pseudohatsudake]
MCGVEELRACFAFAMVVLAEVLLLGTHTLLAGGLCAITALWEVMLPVFRIRGSTIAHMEMLTLDTHETGEQQANGGGDAEACSKWRGVGTDWSNLRTSSNYRECSDEHDFKLDGMLPDCLLPPFSQLDGNMIRNVRPEPEISGLRPNESAACDLGLDFLNRRTLAPQRIQTAADRSDNDAAVCGSHFDDNIAACDRTMRATSRAGSNYDSERPGRTRFANHDDRNNAAATGRACDPDFSPLASNGGEEQGDDIGDNNDATLTTATSKRLRRQRGDPDDNDPTTTMMTTANRQTQQQRQPQQLADDSNPEDCNADDDNPSDGSPDSDDDNLNDNNPNREATTGDDGKATKTTAITRGHSGSHFRAVNGLSAKFDGIYRSQTGLHLNDLDKCRSSQNWAAFTVHVVTGLRNAGGGFAWDINGLPVGIVSEQGKDDADVDGARDGRAWLVERWRERATAMGGRLWIECSIAAVQGPILLPTEKEDARPKVAERGAWPSITGFRDTAITTWSGSQ